MKHAQLLPVITVMFLFTSSVMSAQNVVDHSGHSVATELGSRWQSFIDAWHAEDAKILSAFYTPDAWNIPPGGTIKKGREQIMVFYEELFGANRSSEYSIEILSVEGCDQHVIEIGQFTVHWVRNDDSTWTYAARTVTHWQKEEDGIWYIRTFIFNNPPGN